MMMAGSFDDVLVWSGLIWPGALSLRLEAAERSTERRGRHFWSHVRVNEVDSPYLTREAALSCTITSTRVFHECPISPQVRYTDRRINGLHTRRDMLLWLVARVGGQISPAPLQAITVAVCCFCVYNTCIHICMRERVLSGVVSPSRLAMGLFVCCSPAWHSCDIRTNHCLGRDCGSTSWSEGD